MRLRSALVLGGDSSVPDGDGGGEDGLNDSSLEVHYHRLWQVELLPTAKSTSSAVLSSANSGL